MIDGDDYLQCLVYAHDLAICSNNLDTIQNSIDRLYKYSSGMYLAINVSKNKIIKFRKGWLLAKSDIGTCNTPYPVSSLFLNLSILNV